MMFKPTFQTEPAFSHGQTPRTAVLLCNLGTPDAPTPDALRRYLAEFLGDHRVVEIPRLLWLAILHGIILRVRPAKSAKKYASIWTDEGSPLKVWTERQAQAAAHFSAAVSAREVGVAKPDVRIFHAAASQAGVRPEEVLHVGDDSHADVLGAWQAGMQAVWVSRDNHVWAHEAPQPFTVQQLSELCDHLHT